MIDTGNVFTDILLGVIITAATFIIPGLIVGAIICRVKGRIVRKTASIISIIIAIAHLIADLIVIASSGGGKFSILYLFLWTPIAREIIVKAFGKKDEETKEEKAETLGTPSGMVMQTNPEEDEEYKAVQGKIAETEQLVEEQKEETNDTSFEKSK